jgi:AcrR family transcriptional regulator
MAFVQQTVFVSGILLGMVRDNSTPITANELPVPAWKRTRQPSAPRVQLSRDVIVDSALKLLDADGLDGVSMRRVAEVLGTGPASLYAHVANKDELLDLLLDRIASEIEVPEPDPARWREQLREVGRQTYQVFRRHRDIAVVSLANIPTGHNTLRAADRMFAIMLAGGVPPRVAAWALDRISLYIAADSYESSLYTKRQVSSGLTEQQFMERYIADVRAFYDHLPADKFPHLAKHLGDLTGGDSEERFEFGLDMLIRSLATYSSSDVPAGEA